MIMQLALGPYLICITSSSGNYLSTFEMEENLMELIKKVANFLDYGNLCPKLDDAISSANKRTGQIIIMIELLGRK